MKKIQKFPHFCMKFLQSYQFLSTEKSSSLSYFAYESSYVKILLISSMARSTIKILVYACYMLIKQLFKENNDRLRPIMERLAEDKLLSESILRGFIFFISYSGTIVFDKNKLKYILFFKLCKLRVFKILTRRYDFLFMKGCIFK